jgi:Family of unknown function (DUF5686)/CarboxypepD_reg-like domain
VVLVLPLSKFYFCKANMKLRLLVFISILLLSVVRIAYGQTYKISGIVMDNKREPLPLASVEIKDTKLGQIVKSDGSFSFNLERGQYDLLVSMVGFKSRVINFSISNQDAYQDILLEVNDTASLEEFVVKVKYRDRAEEFVRKVIQNKESHQSAAGAYSCKAYIKGSQMDSVDSKKKKENEADSVATEDYSGMGLSEIVLHLDKSANGEIKEERLGVKKQGNTDYLFYQTTTDGDFNIYNNQLKAPAISRMTFLSPVSYSGLVAYKYKTIKQERVGRRRIITISVKSRLLSNATVEGELVIMDSLWVVLKADFRLPQAHLPENDFFEVKQEYEQVADTTWIIKKQQFNYYSKTKSGRRYGETTVIYSDFELNKNFKRNYFGNELSSTAMEAYERDSSFWNRVRSLPLTEREALYTKYQDSVYRVMQSDAYLDSIDRVLNKVTLGRVLIFGQILNDHRKERMWILPPLTTIIQPFTFGGTRINLAMAYRKTYPSRKNIEFDFTTSYGFRNNDVNGRVSFKKKYNPFNGGKFNVSVGRDFQFIYPGDAWINMLKRSNVYLNTSIEAGHELELLHGLVMINDFEIALRRSVSGYKINENVDDIFGGILSDNRPIKFEPYNAVYGQLKLFYTPKVKYIREPKEKILLYTKWPTFYVTWKKGIKDILKSEVDFDYLEFGIIQQAKLGVFGELNYNIKTGDFLNTRDLREVDYRYMRRGDPFFFGDPQKSFQALDSSFPVFERYYQGNLAHNFQGALISKIPFFKKLKLEEVAGGGFLLAKEKNLRYFEIFAGLERVFKWPVNPLTKLKMGIYVVFSAANKFNNPVKLKIGLTTWDRFKNKWK